MSTELLFDLSALQPMGHGAHGGGEYARAVFNAIAARRPSGVAAYWRSDRPFDSATRHAAESANVELHAVDSYSQLQRLIARLKPARFFSALPYALGGIEFGSAQFVGTIHGLRPIETPSDPTATRYASGVVEYGKALARAWATSLYVARRRQVFGALLRVRARARTFIVPSEYTRRSLLVNFPSLRDEGLQVFYSPATTVAGLPAEQRDVPSDLLGDARRYVLLISAERWVKNTYRALTALEALHRRWPEGERWPVVITGHRPQGFPARWEQQFRFVGRCTAARLAGLYAGAGLLVYPSLNEGFGYPPIEAMSYGTPVLAAGISSIPEIAGDGAAYFCPFSSDDIEVRVWSVLADDEERARLSQRALARYRIVRERQAKDLDALCALLLG